MDRQTLDTSMNPYEQTQTESQTPISRMQAQRNNDFFITYPWPTFPPPPNKVIG